MRGKPHVEAFTSRSDAPGRLNHPRDESAQADRQRSDGRETGEHHDEEDDGWVERLEPSGQAFRDPSFARTKNGKVQPVRRL